MKKFWQVFEFLEDIVSGGLLSLGVTLIFYGVIMRYVFNDARSWVDEISQYMIIWGTLIGTSVALRNNHHIKVDMLFNVMSKKLQHYVTLFAHTVGITFSLFVGFYGYKLVSFTHNTGQVSTDVGIPLYMVYSILPLTGALLTLRFAIKLYETVRNTNRMGHVPERM